MSLDSGILDDLAMAFARAAAARLELRGQTKHRQTGGGSDNDHQFLVPGILEQQSNDLRSN